MIFKRMLTGDPIRVGDQEIVPLLHVTGIGPMLRGNVAGGGGGFVRAVPVGVLERRRDEERHVAIHDATGAALRTMAAARPA